MKQLHAYSEKVARGLIYFLLIWGIWLLIRYDVLPKYPEQQFVFLAEAFSKGHLYFLEMPGYWGDTALYQSQHYWPLGPLPALMLLPAVTAFGPAVQQGYFLFVINVSILFLLYRISFAVTRGRDQSIWLSFAYVFSTCFLYVALRPWSWYFAQAVASLFVLLALNEFFHKNRCWLIGIFVSLAVAARINLVLSLIFFAGSIVLESANLRMKFARLVQLCGPVAVIFGLLLFYNYARFDNIFEFGYKYQLLNHEPALNRDYGLWSIVHFPTNLFYFLFKGPEPVFLPGTTVSVYPYLQPNIWGMSIIFTSPILLWALRAPITERAVFLSLGTILVMLFAILGYYGIGVRQFGYRYGLDFYPFAFVMLAYASRSRLTAPMKVVATISFLLNSYLIALM